MGSEYSSRREKARVPAQRARGVSVAGANPWDLAANLGLCLYEMPLGSVEQRSVLL